MKFEHIISNLPYQKPFLFVDAITEVTLEGIKGEYLFPANSYFYKGHFKNNPITPGVILTECMAQIGLVCFGLHLLEERKSENIQIAMSSSDVEYFKPVFPEEKVKVISKKIYFRFNKLKCAVKMLDSEENLVCKGTLAGMIKEL